jgi:hypothetical protein
MPTTATGILMRPSLARQTATAPLLSAPQRPLQFANSLHSSTARPLPPGLGAMCTANADAARVSLFASRRAYPHPAARQISPHSSMISGARSAMAATARLVRRSATEGAHGPTRPRRVSRPRRERAALLDRDASLGRGGSARRYSTSTRRSAAEGARGLDAALGGGELRAPARRF